MKDSLFLKGGNALRKGYFENTRFSSDLDLGIPGEMPQAELLIELNQICATIAPKCGVAFNTDRNTVEEKFVASEAPLPDLKVWEERVYFNDFYGNANRFQIKISMDVTRFDRTLLPIVCDHSSILTPTLQKSPAQSDA